MRRITFFGKGGIGKSTVSAALAALFHDSGDRVLHVGCDPKHDSSIRHGPSVPVPTVMEEFIRLGGEMGAAEFEQTIIKSTATGVHVIEAGGPEPGKGCAGRAVSMMLTLLDRSAPIREGHYDTVILDVLGDVVCGGFAAPLRAEVASDIVVVASQDFMSLYAANNIAKGISNLTTSGSSRLIGIVANRIQNDIGRAVVDAFAERLQTRVLGVIPYCDSVMLADASGASLADIPRDSRWGLACREVYDALLDITESDRVVPIPLSEPELRGIYAELRGSLS